MKKVFTFAIAIILAIVTGAVCLNFGLVAGHEVGYNKAENFYWVEFEKLTKQYEELALKDSTTNPEFYYGEAYIVSQDKMPDGMVSVSWCVNYSETQCFITYELDYLNEDYPYLLTMYSNGTKDVLDDEVVVIWQAIQ